MTAPALPTAARSPLPDMAAHASGLARTVRVAALLLAVGALFSGAAQWGWNTGRLPAPPIAVIGIVCALAFVAVLVDISRIGSTGIIAWAGASASVAMAAFVWSSGSDAAFQEVRTRVLSSIQLVAFVVLLADPKVRRLARRAIVVASLVAVAMNLWEITHPMAFSMSLGRSAGFYVNPNITGAALIAGMLLGLPAVAPRLREPYLLVVAIGLFTTLSRGALLCWILVIAYLATSRAVRGRRLAMQFAAGGMLTLAIGGAMMASGRLAYLSGGAETFVKQRLSIGNREQLGADVSASSRTHLATRALELFGDRPFTGHGIGATVEWNEPESTHNIYVRQLAEYGIAGAWLAPLLLLLAWRGAGGQKHVTGDAGEADVRTASSYAFVMFVAFWGLFSHNVLDDPFVLIGIGLTAALPAGVQSHLSAADASSPMVAS
jgi:hypothetical protein